MSKAKVEIDGASINLSINWGGKGIGFGQLCVYSNGEDIICHNEGMSRKKIKAILLALVDDIVDNAILMDGEPETDTEFSVLPPIVRGVKIFLNNDGSRSYVMVDGDYFVHPTKGRIHRSDCEYGVHYLDVRSDTHTADQLWLKNFE